MSAGQAPGALGLCATMSLALTIALCLRDDETRLADMAKAAVGVAESLATEHRAGEWHDTTREEAWVTQPTDSRAFDYELLALDESSRDNTLSVLSILHARLPQLRTIPDIPRGTAVMRGARAARGRVWLFVNGPFDAEHGRWAIRQVFCGDAAALVPGELLAVRRNIGQAALGWYHGGLDGAQREVEAMLAVHGQRPAWSPPRDRSLAAGLRRSLRARLGRFARVR